MSTHLPCKGEYLPVKRENLFVYTYIKVGVATWQGSAEPALSSTQCAHFKRGMA
jgi:hypothetical protein